MIKYKNDPLPHFPQWVYYLVGEGINPGGTGGHLSPGKIWFNIFLNPHLLKPKTHKYEKKISQ